MICYNDLVALGLMKPLEPAGIKVPEERWPWSVVTISRPPTWSRRR
jgi:DNA-binding LacI/PurR family transcriptional regulator